MGLIKKIIASGLIWLWVAILVIMVDHFSKLWAVQHLSFGEPVQILPIFNLMLVYNSGAAFSFLHNASGWQNLFFGSIAYLASLLILYWLYQLSAREAWLNIALCFILGGALGNAWDRGVYGYVVDFFDFHLGAWHFATFNVADSAICIGAVMLMGHWMLFPRAKYFRR